MSRPALALVCLLLASFPAAANTSVPANLKPDMAAQLRAEKVFKALIDQWAEPGLEITFVPRPEATLDSPGTVRVYLDGFKAAINPNWYRAYRQFYTKLVKQPFAPEVFRHAAAYCRGGELFMQAESLAGSQVLHTGPVHNLYSMSRAPDTQHFFFLQHQGIPLPERPPSLAYLDHSTAGDRLFTEVPADVAPKVTRLRLRDRPAAEWPVPLEEKPKAPATRAGASAKPLGN